MMAPLASSVEFVVVITTLNAGQIRVPLFVCVTWGSSPPRLGCAFALHFSIIYLSVKTQNFG